MGSYASQTNLYHLRGTAACNPGTCTVNQSLAAMMFAIFPYAAAAITMGADCDKTTSSATKEIKLRWNSFASEWGQYEVEGCSGVSPKLKLSAGVTYTFDQSHASNWYHPVGFAYIAGGAHTVCKDSDGNEGECPEIGGTRSFSFSCLSPARWPARCPSVPPCAC